MNTEYMSEIPMDEELFDMLERGARKLSIHWNEYAIAVLEQVMWELDQHG